jgi:hypothetical protein
LERIPLAEAKLLAIDDDISRAVSPFLVRLGIFLAD